MPIPIITKTAVTSKVTVSSHMKMANDGVFKNQTRVDLSPELSTILGTRYLENQPYKLISVYKSEYLDDFILSLEPMLDYADFELVGQSELSWRKINQNPKSTDFNHDEDAQWFTVKEDTLAWGSYNATVVLDSDEYPRHLVCKLHK